MSRLSTPDQSTMDAEQSRPRGTRIHEFMAVSAGHRALENTHSRHVALGQKLKLMQVQIEQIQIRSLAVENRFLLSLQKMQVHKTCMRVDSASLISGVAA